MIHLFSNLNNVSPVLSSANWELHRCSQILSVRPRATCIESSQSSLPSLWAWLLALQAQRGSGLFHFLSPWSFPSQAGLSIPGKTVSWFPVLISQSRPLSSSGGHLLANPRLPHILLPQGHKLGPPWSEEQRVRPSLTWWRENIPKNVSE